MKKTAVSYNEAVLGFSFLLPGPHLVYEPATGEKYPFADSAIFKSSVFPLVIPMVRKLTGSLSFFYRFDRIGKFLHRNQFSYENAIHKARRDINVNIFLYMEKYY